MFAVQHEIAIRATSTGALRDARIDIVVLLTVLGRGSRPGGHAYRRCREQKMLTPEDCSLVNAPPREGDLGAAGDTVHAVSEGY
jgi:hypothetical protein